MHFRNQVVVVTGGTAGIGRSTVRAFARAGASVAILARDRGRLAATAEEVPRHGTPCAGPRGGRGEPGRD